MHFRSVQTTQLCSSCCFPSVVFSQFYSERVTLEIFPIIFPFFSQFLTNQAIVFKFFLFSCRLTVFSHHVFVVPTKRLVQRASGMSAESLTMDDGREQNGSSDGGGGGGGGWTPGGGGNGSGSNNAVGNSSGSGGSGSSGGGATTNCVSPTPSPHKKHHHVLRNAKAHHHHHRGGFASTPRHGQGNKNLSHSRNADQRHHHQQRVVVIPSSGTENHLPVPGAATAAIAAGVDQPRRRMRKDKSKWKPYHALSWEEKRERDAQETARAEEKRNQLTHLGYPQAPYNTTQFLMGDRGEAFGTSSDGVDVPSSDESSTAEEDWMSMDRGYDQEYDRVLQEQLSGMSKSELIAHVLTTEKEKSKLEHRLRTLERTATRSAVASGEHVARDDVAMEAVDWLIDSTWLDSTL